MLTSLLEAVLRRAGLGALGTGFRYGIVAVIVALAADLRFLYVDPTGIPEWIVAAVESFRTQLALAAFLFLAILAALRVRPTRIDPDVPYRSVLIRDGALAATVVGVMAGTVLLLLVVLQATVLADDVRDYAREASEPIAAYLDEVGSELNDPPPTTPASEIEEDLQPPVLRDVGRSLANLVLRAILLGAVGALVGALRRDRRPAVPEGSTTARGPERAAAP
jgi:hypothetical protein